MISVNYGVGGIVTTVTNAKSSTESEKLTLKIESENGILFTIGCHFPPKSINFGTLLICDFCNILVNMNLPCHIVIIQVTNFSRLGMAQQ